VAAYRFPGCIPIESSLRQGGRKRSGIRIHVRVAPHLVFNSRALPIVSRHPWGRNAGMHSDGYRCWRRQRINAESRRGRSFLGRSQWRSTKYGVPKNPVANRTPMVGLPGDPTIALPQRFGSESGNKINGVGGLSTYPRLCFDWPLFPLSFRLAARR